MRWSSDTSQILSSAQSNTYELGLIGVHRPASLNKGDFTRGIGKPYITSLSHRKDKDDFGERTCKILFLFRETISSSITLAGFKPPCPF